MSSNQQIASALVQKVWNYAHVLKDDGLAFMDCAEQIAFLHFLKMVSGCNMSANKICERDAMS
ncbi:MAG: hypothetical protein WCO56_04955 [Verrucomicrobiota bacterium]